MRSANRPSSMWIVVRIQEASFRLPLGSIPVPAAVGATHQSDEHTRLVSTRRSCRRTGGSAHDQLRASRRAARRAGGSRSACSEPPEPGEIGLPGPALAGLPLEQLFRLAQDQGVWPPRAPCFVAHGELGGIDPLMNVSPALLGE